MIDEDFDEEGFGEEGEDPDEDSDEFDGSQDAAFEEEL